MSITEADPTSATPEAIWKILDGIAKHQKATEKRQKETDRLIRENARRQKETDRQMWETNRRLRGLEDRLASPWEQLVESLHGGDLAKLLRERSMEVAAISAGFRCGSDRKRREVDVLATTEEEAVAVAVRTTLASQDVDDFLDLLVALPSLTQYFRGLRRHAAVAYFGENQGTARYAERKGLFVIRATGNSASIVNPPGFQPHNFG